MIASAQFTIIDLNDPIQQGTAPASPSAGMLWLDISASPPLLKRYNGKTWDSVGDSGAGAEALEAVQQLQAATDIVIGTQTESTSAWTGRTQLSSLKDGQQLIYWLPIASTSTSVTLNLTLKDGTTTGAIPCYYGGTTRLTTHYAAGNAIHLTYRKNVTIGTTAIAQGWWGDANYDSNNYDRIRLNNAIKAKNAISASRLIVSDADGYFHLAPSVPFDITKPILWAGSAVSAGATDTHTYLSYPGCTLRNNLAGFTGVNQKTCYIVGTLDGELFTPSAALFTTTVPDEEDGLIYIALGVMYSEYQVYLYPEHPMFSFVGGSFKNLNQVAYEAPAELETKLAEVHAQITTTADRIRQEVQATYASASDMSKVKQQLSTLSEQAEGYFTWIVSQYIQLNDAVQDVKELNDEQVRILQTYMTFSEDGLVIGKSGNPFTFRVVNDRLAFFMNNTEVAYLSNNKLYVTQAEILSRLVIGKFAFEPQANGNMSIIFNG